MKKYFFVLLSSVLVLVATMAFASQNEQVQPAQGKIKEGAVAPDFSLVGIDGKEVKLSDYKGQYVVLDFWGTWCGWCIKGIPEMKKMYEKYGDMVEIIGIACGDKEEVWRATVEKQELPWVNVLDYDRGSDKSLATIYEIRGYPTKMIIAPDGTIYKIVLGESPLFYEAIEELMK